VKVEGRKVTICLQGSFHGHKAPSVSTVGKERLTTAEGLRENIILRALQGSNPILKLPFVQLIWLPSESPDVKITQEARPPFPLSPSLSFLNTSQQIAVRAIISDPASEPLVLIQGPPGTGKTSVIACATQIMASERPPRTVWLIAQSNVAVKNIAEKLAKTDFLDFKLLVSREFHFDW
jgi:Rad3-related DNA helicase